MKNDLATGPRWMGDAGKGATSERLGIFLRKLMSHSRLSTADQEAVLALPYTIRRLGPNDIIFREGEKAVICPILLSGFAYRHKSAADGGRQIVSLKIPGDALDFQSLYLEVADHSLQALTDVELAVFPLKELEKIVAPRPGLARAVLVDILVEASIGREWLLNLGRRNALARLAHLLCELNHRITRIAGEPLAGLELPLTQEQLADLLGLTPVHVNRTIKTLEREGAVKRVSRRLTIGNLDTLQHIAGFNDLYLHRNDS
ncbi:cAMP-binding domain of CRP or a regulatory subunit of cAMP-dependent protein kinases [Sphingopyxis sp. YR583]|uniref:Crp/Fnr family transcriptional regulator n=1 Tax=Sphingopyxis sp. YR583 TaxID=1881047 RepID=UPI0008A7E87E|nr:Crp/Fnr family transcriptional regulator [Sphingopyxis sp. YR583]SEH13084.1 cAMP-binding domain of CRP or a regulatory subunit of cAMP-dependent protein kinases [Sphingopyxis sp. YR583]